MKEYHKIQTLFKRDEDTHKIIIGVFTKEEFKHLEYTQWVLTEKVDGTNIRIGWDMENVKIGGKTDNAQLHIELIEELQILFPVEKFKELYPETPMTLYGEGYGAGIQKGGKYSQKKSFVLFDILINGFWLNRENVADIAEKLGIQVVPIIGIGNVHNMIKVVESGMKSQWGDFIAEGIVARPRVELFDKKGHRIITKLKHKDFMRGA